MGNHLENGLCRLRGASTFPKALGNGCGMGPITGIGQRYTNGLGNGLRAVIGQQKSRPQGQHPIGNAPLLLGLRAANQGHAKEKGLAHTVHPTVSEENIRRRQHPDLIHHRLCLYVRRKGAQGMEH